jgi:hypothetical protein
MSQSHEADRSSHAADKIKVAGVANDAAAGSESPFSTKADQAMAESKIPNLYE